MNKVHFSSNAQNWGTPKAFFHHLNEEFHFDLDPCCSENTAKCPNYYTEEMDGLVLPWDKGGAVFCNPPYGRELKQWVKKAYEESKNGVTVVMLIPARTDTSYFHDFIYGKAEVRFIRGRLKFEGSDGKPSKNAAPFPSMVVVYRGVTGLGRKECNNISMR